MTTLYLVRHGRTDWNDKGRYQGQCDPPLNVLGLAQARELAEALREVPFAAVYSSDLVRARHTAQVLADAIGVPLRVDARLREIGLGEWAGQLVSAIRAGEPALFARWRSAPAAVRPPGGETVAELYARIAAALDDISRAHPGKTVAVFTHGAAIAAVRCQVRGVPLDGIWTMLPENAAWEVVEWPPAR
jgi:broad specificity phosphatase PhoE